MPRIAGQPTMPEAIQSVLTFEPQTVPQIHKARCDLMGISSDSGAGATNCYLQHLVARGTVVESRRTESGLRTYREVQCKSIVRFGQSPTRGDLAVQCALPVHDDTVLHKGESPIHTEGVVIQWKGNDDKFRSIGEMAAWFITAIDAVTGQQLKSDDERLIPYDG